MDRAQPTVSRSHAARRLIWTGSALWGVVAMTIVLSSIYRAMAGLQYGTGSVAPALSLLPLLVAIAVGTLLIAAGLLLQSTSRKEPGSVEPLTEPERWKIAV